MPDETSDAPPRGGRLPGGWGPVVVLALVGAAGPGAFAVAGEPEARPIDFNREIRPILSNHCYACHGPDAGKRKGLSQPLRLDTPEGAFADLGGYAAIVKGNPEESDLIQRVNSDEPAERMPPHKAGKTKLSAKEIERLTAWIRQGAPFAKHWAYVKPARPTPPAVRERSWPKNPIDNFILNRHEGEGLAHAPEADRPSLIRRVSLDLTGLPPTVEEVDAFVHDASPDAFDILVDRLLARPSYGEHWARMWLDLARYADSSGYADDPPRTIWAYRDYVIRAFNANMPFDRFTVEQIAGDLLPNPTDDQLIATAFHRNTPTNNEGGTVDEEFRNVAVVDRVNTTMAVWMATTVACAQCHDHKFDPLSQEEYFKLFAFFNNTADTDTADLSPVRPLFSEEQERRKADGAREILALETTLKTPTPELLASQGRWEQSFATELPWEPVAPTSATSRGGAKLTTLPDKSILVEAAGKDDVYRVDFPLGKRRLAALRLEALPDDSLPSKGPGHASGNFVVSRVLASITPPQGHRTTARYVRIELPGAQKYLSLAEVEVFQGSMNVAPQGVATQSSTALDGTASKAIDGNTDGRYAEAKSTTHTALSDDPWWEVDLKTRQPIDRLVVWNRTDNALEGRLAGFRIALLDEDRQPVWTRTVAEPPRPSADFAPGGARSLTFGAAYADYSQPMFDAASVLATKEKETDAATQGWAIGGQTGQRHTLTLGAAAPVDIEPGSTLTVNLEQLSPYPAHTLGRFRIAATDDERAGVIARTPAAVLALLKREPDRRDEAQRAELTRYYLGTVAPELAEARGRLASLKAQLAALKPATSVPVQAELPAGGRRKTKIQHRGNYLDLGKEVTEGVPAVFPPLPDGAPRDRLALARWLVDEQNPLTARVVANRYWEQIFGAGLVPTSEEFGSQGEPPTHPELLDWLATELVRDHWDLKQFLRLLVTSATYRQTSRIDPESARRDPENQILTRGPRFRLAAEAIRDQALAVGGLLSAKMYGLPVNPPQAATGLAAAFGGGIDWQTSMGEDRHRRALYTTWRRSNPYPSMTTFDAPNRDVCTMRRTRTNTPLQALVTLNDPVYVEAAQALARRIDQGGKTAQEKARFGFRLCLAREPAVEERDRLVRLFEATREEFAGHPAEAVKMASDPLGPAPEDANLADLAAWTVVGNVLMNLDEFLMKR